MTPPPNPVQKLLDHPLEFLIDAFSTLDRIAAPSQEELVRKFLGQHHQLMKLAKEEALVERRNKLLGESPFERFRDSSGFIAGVAFPPLIPFLMMSDGNFMEEGRIFFQELGIAQGLRNFWADVEKGREAKAQCLAAEENREAREITEEKIKTLITSKNGSLFSMENVNVRLEGGRIQITGTADFPGPDYELNLVIRLSGKNGNIEGEVESLTLDGDPINESLLGILLDRIRGQGIKMPKNPDLKDLSWIDIPDLYALEVKDGKIVMEFSEC